MKIQKTPEFMKNYPKPLLTEIMQSLYYLYSNDFIEYEQLLHILSSDYEVCNVIITEDKFTCTARHGSDFSVTSISI